MQKTKKGETGLTDLQIKRKEELVKELRIRFEYVQAAIDSYNATLKEANEFVGEMREIFENYYRDREDNWEHANSYYDFVKEWQGIELDNLEIEDHSTALEELNNKVIRY
ncbi:MULTISPECIES: hypothetical protein [Pseudanabaena]|uniref:hypothetical protein n=1 Tax=Pseudanabaena TaxID=1152 RepID=UPI00247A5B2D|nr:MULTISPECIES: hypothetical protein [Pseudanabaena]MEA5486499.1 hypothetical protein [Pseudanabaena sp. CCNP1317]WGS74184.1 hypothetical protein OA858_09205 [Pseudanabaena galeata CCNP1313]